MKKKKNKKEMGFDYEISLPVINFFVAVQCVLFILFVDMFVAQMYNPNMHEIFIYLGIFTYLLVFNEILEVIYNKIKEKFF